MAKNEDLIDEKIKILEQQAETLKKQKAYEQIEQPPLFASIPKKTAALEVLKHLKVARLLGIGSMVGVFLLLLLQIFGAMPMYIGAVVLVIPAAVITAKNTAEIKRLCSEYDIK